MTPGFWKEKRVFMTGHTGFKGSWLSLWLKSLGADVTGYALKPPTTPSLFELARVAEGIQSIEGDVRDLGQIRTAMQAANPEIVIHMAAQPLVRYAYRHPVETYSTNVMGTVNVLEAVRATSSVRAVIVVTSDKCYENREWLWGYRENEAMGGHDPYSSSKGCAELVTAAYRSSYADMNGDGKPGAAIASVRVGNVIGGGDWAEDRLIPDILRAVEAGQTIRIRNPNAVRPWQHVLEPLSGYLLLAERLCDQGAAFAEGWNFGPNDDDARSVGWIVERLSELWGGAVNWCFEDHSQPHEAHYLKLDCAKARGVLGWQPRWTLQRALAETVAWHRAYLRGEDMRSHSLRQIAAYFSSDCV